MKIHLGCGKRILKGFFHIDLADYPHIDLRTSADDLSMITSSSVSEIYSAHTLEYFDRFDAVNVLAEWNRVLRPGGKLYLSVPDFDQLVKIYLSEKKLQNIIGPLFGRWQDAGLPNTLYHKTVWNLETLSQALFESGFLDVKQFSPIEYLEKIDPTYDDHSLAFFPHMDRSGIQVSLCLESRK